MKILSQMVVTILFAMLLVSSCNTDCIEGSGNQVTETRQVSDFSRIEITGHVKLVLIQRDFKEVKIVADDNVQKHIRTHVSGNTLEIERKGNICNGGIITVYVTNKYFEGVEVSGEVEVITEGLIKADNFELDLSGLSKVNLELNAGTLETKSSGSSDISLRGQAGNHNLDISGSSQVNAFDFIVGRYKVSTSGNSKVRINVLNELDIDSSGATEIEYKGNPAKVNEDKSGASSLKKVD